VTTIDRYFINPAVDDALFRPVSGGINGSSFADPVGSCRECACPWIQGLQGAPALAA